MQHSLKIRTEFIPHIFCVVNWFKCSDSTHTYKNPVSLWKAKHSNVQGLLVICQTIDCAVNSLTLPLTMAVIW